MQNVLNFNINFSWAMAHQKSLIGPQAEKPCCSCTNSLVGY